MRKSNIKAIETHYNGYRFRSRLEARWAVYFDALGIEYEYEPEGYVLQGGSTYLPDFYLPLVDAYVEVKSKHSTEIDSAKWKMERLAENTNKFGLLCVGDPADNEIYIYGRITKVYGYGIIWDSAEFIIGAEQLSDDLLTVHRVFDKGIVVGDRYNQKLLNVSKPNGYEVRTVVPFSSLYGFDRIPYREQEQDLFRWFESMI